MPIQIPLPLGPRDRSSFESFVAGPNREGVAYLQGLLDGTAPAPVPVVVWGPPASGKSHLLQALVRAAGGGVSGGSAYLPLWAADQYPCEILEGLEGLRVACLDDVDRVAGRRDWERAIAELARRTEEARGRLVLATRLAPAALEAGLPALGPRLALGLSLGLEALDAEGRMAALRRRVERRGLPLAANVARYLIRHYGSDMTRLMRSLDAIEHAALSSKRRLTIPFVRAVLAERGRAPGAR